MSRRIVTIAIKMFFDAEGEVTDEQVRDALGMLASNMDVQAEDGLYVLGSEDADPQDYTDAPDENTYLGDLTVTQTLVHIET